MIVVLKSFANQSDRRTRAIRCSKFDLTERFYHFLFLNADIKTHNESRVVDACVIKYNDVLEIVHSKRQRCRVYRTPKIVMIDIFDDESNVLVLDKFDSNDDEFDVDDVDCILSQISKRARARAIDASV